MYNKIEALAEPGHFKKRKKMSGSVNREAMEKATTVRAPPTIPAPPTLRVRSLSELPFY
jgi:hypothetical protein